MTTNKKHYFNSENITIKGNIGSDITLKTKNKERVEFSIAVNKAKATKWFNIIAFDESFISAIKNNKDYKKGANVEVQGEVLAEIYNNKPLLKIIARNIALNTA